MKSKQGKWSQNWLEGVRNIVTIIGAFTLLVTFVVNLLNWARDPQMFRIISCVGYILFLTGIIWYAWFALVDNHKHKQAQRKKIFIVAFFLFFVSTALYFVNVCTWFCPPRDLPIEGQLIIPANYAFRIPKGMVGTTWYLPVSNTDWEQAIEFANATAHNRSERENRAIEDFPTVVLIAEKLPEGDVSTCTGFYSQSIDGSGAVVGENDCILVLEYAFK